LVVRLTLKKKQIAAGILGCYHFKTYAYFQYTDTVTTGSNILCLQSVCMQSIYGGEGAHAHCAFMYVAFAVGN